MADDFEKLLNTKVEDIKELPPLPAGTWTFKIVEVDCPDKAEVIAFNERPESERSKEDKAPSAVFTVIPVKSGPDVSKAALDLVPDWKETKLRIYRALTARAMPMLSEFQKHCGVKNMAVFDAIPKMFGMMFNAVIKHSLVPGTKRKRADIKSTAPAK